MSEVAGRMSTQMGAEFLQRFNGGMGILLGGIPGVPKEQSHYHWWWSSRYKCS